MDDSLLCKIEDEGYQIIKALLIRLDVLKYLDAGDTTVRLLGNELFIKAKSGYAVYFITCLDDNAALVIYHYLGLSYVQVEPIMNNMEHIINMWRHKIIKYLRPVILTPTTFLANFD